MVARSAGRKTRGEKVQSKDQVTRFRLRDPLQNAPKEGTGEQGCPARRCCTQLAPEFFGVKFASAGQQDQIVTS
jgi:hypothetical protein